MAKRDRTPEVELEQGEAMPEPEPVAEESAAPDDGKKTVEEWSAQKGTPDWLFAAVFAYQRAKGRWAVGTRVTEADFVDAVARLADPKHPKAVKFGG